MHEAAIIHALMCLPMCMPMWKHISCKDSYLNCGHPWRLVFGVLVCAAAPSENRPVCEARAWGRLELSTLASLCVENNRNQHALRESGVWVRGLNPGRSGAGSSAHRESWQAAVVVVTMSLLCVILRIDGEWHAYWSSPAWQVVWCA